MTYVFDERTLVLEGVTLAEVVKFVVEMLVDLAGGTVLDQQAAEHAKTAHPHNLTAIDISIYVHTNSITLYHCIDPPDP